MVVVGQLMENRGKGYGCAKRSKEHTSRYTDIVVVVHCAPMHSMCVLVLQVLNCLYPSI